jgi:hypothetical protein
LLRFPTVGKATNRQSLFLQGITPPFHYKASADSFGVIAVGDMGGGAESEVPGCPPAVRRAQRRSNGRRPKRPGVLGCPRRNALQCPEPVAPPGK